ncbi:MAG: PQQ-like beta-propeller repeat protein [Planctomycetaceae bacterium]|nr:PQQ-like beta-propeller repeat protein [Planctomycetaceae bacterium]
MTDAELIELVEQKTPDELTPDEIECLRARLAESPELRELLIGQLQMETYLTAALGRVNITPQQIVARAQKQPETGSAGVLIVLGVLICLPLATLIGAVVMNTLRDRGSDAIAGKNEQEGKATREGEAPAEPPALLDEPAVAPAQSKPRRNKLRDAILAAQGKPPLGDQALPPSDPPRAKKTDTPPVAAPPAPLPWQAALDQAGPLPEFKEVALRTFDPTKAMPQREDLRIWFEQVPGFNFQVHRVDTQFGPCGALEGVARLRAPWPENAVLRLSLENYNRLKLHFYHGDAGVTLIYYEDQNYRWAAYATTREPGKPLPKTWAIAGTDDDRCRRTELRQGGPIDISYVGGELILSRGDIVLTSAPLAGPPREVIVEGRAAFEGIALARATGAPAQLPASPVVLDVTKPTELAWQPSKPDLAKIESLAGGGVRFIADKAKERVHYFAPLAFDSPREVIFELDDLSPGAGVHFVYDGGKAFEVVRFYLDRRSQQLAAQIRGWDDEWQVELPSPSDRSTGFVGSKCWVKLLYGCGNVRWWLSSDGTHWAQAEMAHDGTQPRPVGIGVQLVANRPDTHVTLRRLTVRELAGLAALAPPELRGRAMAVTSVNSLGQWVTEVVAKKPADVASADWLRACAVRSLGAGMHREQAYQILEALLDNMTSRDLPLEAQLAALNDAALVSWDLRDSGAMRRGIPRRMWELGLAAADRAAADRDGVPAWSAVRHSFMSVPWFTHLVGPPELERIVRAESIQRAYDAPSADTLNYVRTLKLFQQQRYSPLVDWLAAQAARDLPNNPGGEGPAKIKDGWRDPLVEELSKETYNTLTEIQAVLESEAWPEAARLITSVDAEAAPGVAPYFHDRMLLASLPVAVRLALDDFPQVRTALGDRYGPLAKLRIGQATAAGDAATVEMATVQFAGTDAAAEAHQWLGDRALSSGWFERAIAEYRRAIGLTPGLKSQIEPRIRLAAAMLGRDEGQPVSTSVQFNELSMSPAEFEALVAEMRGRGNVATLPSAASSPNARPQVPAAKHYEAHLRSRLDGPVGDRPQEEVGERRTNQFRVPWADRQIATVVLGDVMYVSNRFQIAAYNLTNGQRMWQSQPPPGPIQRSQEWAMIAMQPLVTGNRIFARHLYGNNPTLACWEREGGKLLWSIEAPSGEFFVSDPVIVQGQLGALSVQVQTGQLGLLRWNTIDPESGELQSQADVVRLRNTWGKRTCCEVLALDDSLIAVLGGITLSIDPAGKPRWVRKHVTVPAEEDPRWVLQRFHPPLVADDRLYIAQPGVRSALCLDPATGRQIWSVVLPELLGLVGLSGREGEAPAEPRRLIVRTESDLRALDRASGQTVWRTPASELHSFQLVDDRSLLIAARERTPQTSDQWLTRLTWLDAATGNAAATCVLPNLVDADPRLGPLVSYKDRIFTFFGRGQHDPNRDVVELIPTGDADKPVPLAVTANPWLSRIPPQLTTAAYQVLPDWRLLRASDGDRTGLVPEAHGERDVFGVRSTGATSIVLAREIKLPAMDRPRLRLRFANDAGQVWKLAVRLGEQVLKTEEIKDDTHKDRWKTIEVDLAPAAGQSGWLAVELQSTNGDHTLWWKGAEVVY